MLCRAALSYPPSPSLPLLLSQPPRLVSEMEVAGWVPSRLPGNEAAATSTRLVGIRVATALMATRAEIQGTAATGEATAAATVQAVPISLSPFPAGLDMDMAVPDIPAFRLGFRVVTAIDIRPITIHPIAPHTGRFFTIHVPRSTLRLATANLFTTRPQSIALRRSIIPRRFIIRRRSSYTPVLISRSTSR